MKTIGSSETRYLPTIYTVYNTKKIVTGIYQPAFYSKTILRLPKLRCMNGNDPGDLDLFQEISIRLVTVKIIGNQGKLNSTSVQHLH